MANEAAFFSIGGQSISLRDDTAPNRYMPIVDLGTSYTSELKDDISTGTFKKAVVGGKLTINSHVYYFAHPDYWLNTGDTVCTTHHMVVVPGDNYISGKMNNTDITTGGYVGSDFKTGSNSNTALANIKNIIKTDFGAANILTHRELLVNSVSSGNANSWGWYDSDIDLMSESMAYGQKVWVGPSGYGYDVGVSKSQLKLFQERHDLISIRGYSWLRTIGSASQFTVIAASGMSDIRGASNTHGIRPAFAVC